MLVVISHPSSLGTPAFLKVSATVCGELPCFVVPEFQASHLSEKLSFIPLAFKSTSQALSVPNDTQAIDSVSAACNSSLGKKLTHCPSSLITSLSSERSEPRTWSWGAILSKISPYCFISLNFLKSITSPNAVHFLFPRNQVIYQICGLILPFQNLQFLSACANLPFLS